MDGMGWYGIYGLGWDEIYGMRWDVVRWMDGMG